MAMSSGVLRVETFLARTPDGNDAEVTFGGTISRGFRVDARCPFTDTVEAGVLLQSGYPSEHAIRTAIGDALRKLDRALIDRVFPIEIKWYDNGG